MYLEIKTESIQKFLCDIFKKNINDILISDLLLVESLTVDGEDFDGRKLNIYFQEIKEFKNLKYLEISNTLINNNIINILSKLSYLENVVFRNCTFSKQIKDMDKLTNITNLRIDNCYNFDLSFIKNLSNIKRLSLSGIKKIDFSVVKYQLYSLDISKCFLNDFENIDIINVNTLIISKREYELLINKNLKYNYQIIVMADPSDGYYIEKWIN